MRLLGIGLPSSTLMMCSCQAGWLCASSRRISHGGDLVTHDSDISGLTARSLDGLRCRFPSGRPDNIDSLITGFRFSETLLVGEDSQFFGLLRRTAKPIRLPNVLTGSEDPQRLSELQVLVFQKRLIEHWHDKHKNELPPVDFSGIWNYIDASLLHSAGTVSGDGSTEVLPFCGRRDARWGAPEGSRLLGLQPFSQSWLLYCRCTAKFIHLIVV